MATVKTSDDGERPDVIVTLRGGEVAGVEFPNGTGLLVEIKVYEYLYSTDCESIYCDGTERFPSP